MLFDANFMIDVVLLLFLVFLINFVHFEEYCTFFRKINYFTAVLGILYYYSAVFASLFNMRHSEDKTLFSTSLNLEFVVV